MSKQFNYQRYLASREWAVLKRRVRERSDGFCERGHDEPVMATAVHHLTYERIGHESLEDLQHVCEPCHAYLSGGDGDDPAEASRLRLTAETHSQLNRAAVWELLWWYHDHYGPPDVADEEFRSLLVCGGGFRGHPLWTGTVQEILACLAWRFVDDGESEPAA